ncbi:Gfo/Idh/MocA family protein [Salininema proteolyticum]|uniref:Gfo/Idh/MocA family protein n=1 Tax=Salininema proteolyticum TaxID=1607685 RepID=A0ABV8TVD8_9ACTN
MTTTPVRIGLVGTGHWARTAHAAALSAHDGVDFTGVWGRDSAKTAALAEEYGVQAYPSFRAMLDSVDAVAFAVPPNVQAGYAIEAARAGKHLFLDKPTALTVEDAAALATETAERDRASVVFFKWRFDPPTADFARRGADGTWDYGRAVMRNDALAEGSPYAPSQWRHDEGGLWDVGPHALSLLLPALGPVDAVSAVGSSHSTTTVLLHHRDGGASTMALSLKTPREASEMEVVIAGESGSERLPDWGRTPVPAYHSALDELLHQITTGENRHGCDAAFGRDVVAVLSAADEAARTGAVVSPA